MTTTYETTDHANRYDPEADRESGPTGELETYAETQTGREIRLTTDEREAFELDEDESLKADVLPEQLFGKLLDWVRDNCGYEEVEQ